MRCVKLVLLFFFLSTTEPTRAQSNIDSLFHQLNNDSLMISPIIYYSSWLLKEEYRPIVKETKPRKRATVTSLVSIDTLANLFSEKIVSQKLFELLADKKRDIYAHALLTELFLPQKLPSVEGKRVRKELMILGVMENIRKDWQEILESKGYLIIP
jgi:hypothetical protein